MGKNLCSELKNTGKKAALLLVAVLSGCPNYNPAILEAPENAEVAEGSFYSAVVRASDANKKDVLELILSQTPSKWLTAGTPTATDNGILEWEISGIVPQVRATTESHVSINVTDRINPSFWEYDLTILNIDALYPETTIAKGFDDNGNVNYTFSATDADGSVSYISARFNSTGEVQTFDNNSSVSVPIISGTNSVEAIAYDNTGEADQSPATDSFISPSEDTAREIIRAILAGKKAEDAGLYESLEEQVLLSPGEADSFYVDFLLGKIRGTNKDAVLTYIGYEKNWQTESVNKGVLDSYGIPNCYFNRLPESEISARLSAFIDGVVQNEP